NEIGDAMRTSTALFLFTFFYLSAFAYDDSLREIELIDGSTIRAHVLSMDGKTYRLRSETLGEIEISEYRVKEIRTPQAQNALPKQRPTTTQTVPFQNDTTSTEADTTPTFPNSSTTAIPSTGDVQQALTQDPAAMSKILSLQDDPLVQSI